MKFDVRESLPKSIAIDAFNGRNFLDVINIDINHGNISSDHRSSYQILHNSLENSLGVLWQ